MHSSTVDLEPLVSVAVPVYNGQATVGEALRSLLAQTYPNLEVIVVDDGSTDGTWEILKSFGTAIRAIRQPNSGIAAARNAGLAAARGEFIALMDHDDLCEVERISVQVKFLRERPELVLCCSDFGAFNSAGTVATSYIGSYYGRCAAAEGGPMARYPEHGSLDVTQCLSGSQATPVVVPTHFGPVYEELALGNFVHPPTVMFRRSLLAEAGYFDQDVKIMCEWEWLVRVARVGPIGFIDRPLLKYRLSPSQISFSEEAALDTVQVARRICERDPALLRRRPERYRVLFGGLYAVAADSRAEKHPIEALSLLATSILRYRTFTRQTPRTLFKLLAPAPLLELVRFLTEAGTPML